MANPNYALLLAQIAAETDPVAKAALIAQCYVFEETPTLEEQELFEYCAFDYVENNPGYIEGSGGTSPLYVLADYVIDGYINIETAGSVYAAYTGVYFNDNGDRT